MIPWTRWYRKGQMSFFAMKPMETKDGTSVNKFLTGPERTRFPRLFSHKIDPFMVVKGAELAQWG